MSTHLPTQHQATTILETKVPTTTKTTSRTNLHHAAWASQQSTAVQDPGGTRHPSQYRDRIKPEDHPATGEYAKAFNKFRPKMVEVNKATIEEAIKYGHYLKRSEEDIAEAIDIYKH